MPALRICVLISGSGTNLQALIDARDAGRLDIEIVQVISNVASATGLERARKAGIPCSVLEHQAFTSRPQFDQALALLMAASSPDLYVFAGFMRIVGEEVVMRHEGKMINLHPSLLPLYPGLHTYQRALEAGDAEHGASVHFLTAELDGGPVIAQRKIPILPSDDAEALSRRLAPQEHLLIVATVELFCRQQVEYRDGLVVANGSAHTEPFQLNDQGVFDFSD